MELVTSMYHLMYLPRRSRGSQSGWEKRRDESFQVWAKEPLGTDSHRTTGCPKSSFLYFISL